MANNKKRITPHPDQPNLFDRLREINSPTPTESPAVGRLDIDEAFRRQVSAAIKRSNLSRHQIAGEMSSLLDREITKSMLDAWTAPSKEGHRMPAAYVPAFCEAAGGRAPLRLLNENAGVFMMPGGEALRAEIQRYDEKIKALQGERRKRLLFLQEAEGAKDDGLDEMHE